jgi:methylglutaconyl-CoA hydratase
MSYQTILVERQGPVATVRLNRPDVHNALDDTLISDLTNAAKDLSADISVRVIVLTGEGASFCAGADLNYMKRMAGYSKEENLADARALQRCFQIWDTCPKFVIGKVNGAAIGGGVGLVSVCDYVVAVDSAKFALSEVRLGIVPAVVGPYVVNKIGQSAARALFLTGERIDAEQACRIGLVTTVAASEALDSAVKSAAKMALQSGPEAIKAAKELIRRVSAQSTAESAEYTATLIANLRASDEGREGINAFIEKRKPSFYEEPRE